jgi:uncharacterized LabA/DUF88 family protein
MQAPDSPSPAARQVSRIRVFVDYWNFQLTLNEVSGIRRFKVDWRGLGPWLAKKACEAVNIDTYSFEGVIIYASFNPNTDEGRKFRGWATGWLDRQAGVTVKCFPRRPKAPPTCPACHQVISTCPHCDQSIKATVEKGVDTLIATDMIRLAWENAYDVAVLATLDADLVPAVEFLDLKARKVIQAGFPPKGSHLAAACWASFDVKAGRAEIERP